ncbi:MAG: UpxY family transcription antiterminator [Candidatus Omnitrophica bacterium]|nr:UpxY family transcription antiterminator [Candidatus Omnitrophota bacterium]
MLDKKFTAERWYVLYTKPRHEKFVEDLLLKKGIEAFTPKATFHRRWSDRGKTDREPVFKGYCFARFPLKDKRNIISAVGVMDIINFNNEYPPVEDEVIESLKKLTDKDLKLDPCPYIQKGDRVSIKRGPFKGVEGFVVHKKNRNTTLVVSVDAIGASVKCDIDADLVDPAGGYGGEVLEAEVKIHN